MTERMEHGELRDRLVDLVHGTGDAVAHTAWSDAVAADAELADDLAFLHAARAALTPAPRPVNVDAIVAAIPPYRAQPVFRASRWRIAAALATIAIGGTSLVVVQQAVRGDAGGQDAIVAETAMVVADATDDLVITFGQGLTELSDDDVDALLTGLSDFDGLPSTEPVRSVRVDPTIGAGGN